MSKKILRILKIMTKRLQDSSDYPQELMQTVNYDGEALEDIGRELEDLEFSRSLDEEELDILKALLVYLLLRDSSYEEEDIYSFVFGKGRAIVWN